MRADQVRALRSLSNLSLRRVAAAAGTTWVSWLAWEKGRPQRAASAARLWGLAESLDLRSTLEALAPTPPRARNLKAFDALARGHARRAVAAGRGGD